MNITNHVVSSATVAETADLASNVCTAVENTSIADTYLTSLVVALKLLVAQILKGMTTKKGKKLKNAIDAADLYRDDLLMALVYFLNGFIRWNKEATGTAAKLLLAVIKTQGSGITQLSYEKESAKVDAILKNFENEDMVQALTTTNLTTLAGELKLAQVAFAALYLKSAAIEAVKATDQAPSSVRRQAQQQVNDIVDYVKNMAKANAGTYSSLSGTLIKMVGLLNQKVRARCVQKPKKPKQQVLQQIKTHKN